MIKDVIRYTSSMLQPLPGYSRIQPALVSRLPARPGIPGFPEGESMPNNVDGIAPNNSDSHNLALTPEVLTLAPTPEIQGREALADLGPGEPPWLFLQEPRAGKRHPGILCHPNPQRPHPPRLLWGRAPLFGLVFGPSSGRVGLRRAAACRRLAQGA